METHKSSLLLDLGYKAIIDSLPCYISIQDRALNILFTNQSFINDFGEGVGRPCHLVYKGRDERCKSCPVQKSFNDKRVHLSEETVRLASGQIAQMVVYSAPLPDIAGNTQAVIEMAVNITKVKEMKKELRSLGQVMAILSHDIKNVLEGLQGGAYVVDEGVKDGDMKLARRGWDIVKKNINEITSIVQNILYSSKKREVKRQLVSPHEIVEGVVRMFQEKGRSMGIELRHIINPALPLVRLEPLSVQRMLNNLIWNALEACKNDKEKDFHTVVVRADFYDRSRFMFEVEDNGIGMKEDVIENIFEEFYSTKGSGGTGLGLLVVDKVAKEHQGKTEVLTAPGVGSTFRVILKIR